MINVGDKVRCINNYGLAKWIKKGIVYTVHDVIDTMDGIYIELNEIDESAFWIERFESTIPPRASTHLPDWM